MKTIITLLISSLSLLGCTSTRFQLVDSETDFAQLNFEIGDKITTVTLVTGEVFLASGVFVAGDSTSGIIEDGSVREWKTDDTVTLSYGSPSRRLRGLGVGAGIGAAIGMVMGMASGDDPPGWWAWTAEQKALFGGVLLGGAGGILGAIIARGGGYVDYVFDSASYVPPSEPKLMVSFSSESSRGRTGHSVEEDLRRSGMGETFPASCVSCDSGSMIQRSSRGWRFGIDYRLSDLLSVGASFLKTGIGNVRGFSTGSMIYVDYKTSGLESQISMNPDLGKST